MTTLRNIWADLVEKRLWPGAVLLLAALVAVPVVLARDPGAGEVPTPGAQAALAAAANRGETIVTLDTSPRVRRHDGRGRDPFVQPKSSAPKEPEGPKDAGAGGSAAAGGGDPAGAPSGGSAKPQTPPAKGKPKSSGPRYVVDLRFGQAESMKTLRDVPRLTPLPSASSPFFVFIGVRDDGRTAVFLVSSDAKATGDGKCRPSSRECETIELKAGDTEFFDLSTDDGVQQYQMDILKIRKSGGSSSGKAARAARAKTKASKADRRLLRKVIAGRSAHLMGSYRWVARRGVLVHVPAWADERSSRTLDSPSEGTPSRGTGAD